MIRDAFRGALAGAAATWLMDLVTTGLYEAQPAEVTKAEEAGRDPGQVAYTVAIRVLERAGIDLVEDPFPPPRPRARAYHLFVPGHM